MLRILRTYGTPRRERRGSVVVLAAALMVVLAAFLAFSVDMGYLAQARTELQRAADAAAMAAAWELIDEAAPTGASLSALAMSNARGRAAEYAGLNPVCGSTPTVDSNSANLADGDVVIGYLASFSDLNAAMDYTDTSKYNAIRVRVQRSVDQNGEVPLFFANVLGISASDVQAEATAGAMRNIVGFRAPADGSPLGVLPIALSEDAWDAMIAGDGDDDLMWDADAEVVVAGSDGIVEGNMYPGAVGQPGNFGTIDIGPANNSTQHLSSQITDGITADDLDYHGGSLQLDEYGELLLTGDTGISTAIKDDLAQIIGQPKIMPLYRTVADNGNNSTYTIVRWVGVRLLDVQLTGNDKRVIFQPANIVTDGAIAAAGDQGTSEFVYARPTLIR